MDTAQFTLQLNRALQIIAGTRGYEKIAIELAQLVSDGKLRTDEKLEERAFAALNGVLTLGPEAWESSALSLAQTLVHEHFHLQQNPLEKTVSFWSGVLARRHVMARFEKPAYRAAHDFLEAVKASHPELAKEANFEQRAIAQVFENGFGQSLLS